MRRSSGRSGDRQRGRRDHAGRRRRLLADRVHVGHRRQVHGRVRRGGRRRDAVLAARLVHADADARGALVGRQAHRAKRRARWPGSRPASTGSTPGIAIARCPMRSLTAGRRSASAWRCSSARSRCRCWASCRSEFVPSANTGSIKMTLTYPPARRWPRRRPRSTGSRRRSASIPYVHATISTAGRKPAGWGRDDRRIRREDDRRARQGPPFARPTTSSARYAQLGYLVPGAVMTVAGEGDSGSGGDPIFYTLSGPDDQLEGSADKLGDIHSLDSGHRQRADRNRERRPTGSNINIDRAKCALLGVSPGAASIAARIAIGGAVATRVRTASGSRRRARAVAGRIPQPPRRRAKHSRARERRRQPLPAERRRHRSASRPRRPRSSGSTSSASCASPAASIRRVTKLGPMTQKIDAAIATAGVLSARRRAAAPRATRNSSPRRSAAWALRC